MINNKLLKQLLVSDGCIRGLGGIKEIKTAYLNITKKNIKLEPQRALPIEDPITSKINK